MRQLLLIFLGLVIGALATANIVNALRQRDAYPRGLMNVMQHHFSALRNQVKTQHCGQQAQTHLLILRVLSNQIETAIYSNHTPDPGFANDATRLRTQLDMAQKSAQASDSCAALAPVVNQVGQVCDTCHRSYR